MKITKYDHSCMLIEEGGARILIDPGAYSSGFESLRELDAILITHVHPDHIDQDRYAELVKSNPKAQLYGDEDSQAELAKRGIEIKVARNGDKFEIAGVLVEVIGSVHAIIHPSWGQAKNVGYKIAGRFYYPGDALTKPDGGIEILAIPAAAPWSKVSETVDYLMEVKPKYVIPVHDGFLSRPSLFGQMIGSFADRVGTQMHVLENGVAVEL